MAIISKKRQEEIDNIIERIKINTGLSYPNDDLLKIAESLGIKVFLMDFKNFTPFDGRKIDGVIEWEKGNAKIYINKEFSPTRKTFTLAHEIGHCILHPNKKKLRIDSYDYSKQGKESKEETEANYFAASLLVPKSKLSRLLKITKDLDAIAKYFGVSRPVIEIRLNWLQTN